MRENQKLIIAIVVACVSSFVGSPLSHALVAQENQSDQTFPYQGLVLAERASIHSGPGEVHYATNELEQGSVVDVYRHDPGGWCAIRPPRGSFSLVPESALEIIEEKTGRVTEDGIQAWVGTQLGPVDKTLWQVKLRRDELVEVLGQFSWPDPAGHSTTWYQIAPPAGEFRWIRISDIQLPSVATKLPREQPVDRAGNIPSTRIPNSDARSNRVRSLNELVQELPRPDLSTAPIPTVAESNFDSIQPVSSQAPIDDGSRIAEMNRGWRQATRPIEKSLPVSNQHSNFSTQSFPAIPNRNDGFALRSSPIRTASADLSGSTLASGLNRSGNLIGGQRASGASRTIRELEQQLTQQMLKQPQQWQLDELEATATNIYQNSFDPIERNGAEKFLSKIKNCKQIRQGYQNNFSAGPTSAVSTGAVVGTGVDTSVQLAANYDAYGWLNQMVRDSGQSQPTYVLQDNNGKITHHVSPAPGVNIHRFLKSKVGIIGQRGYHNQLKLDHVTASRIVELEKRR